MDNNQVSKQVNNTVTDVVPGIEMCVRLFLKLG